MVNKAKWIAAIAAATCMVVDAQAAMDPASVFARYVEAVNAGDKAALRELIPEEVERHTYGACTTVMSNRDCLLAYVSDTVIDQHGRLQATGSLGLYDQTVYGGLSMTSDAIRASGAERIVGIDEIRTRSGRIVGLSFLPNWQDAQTRKYLNYRRDSGMPRSRRTVENARVADGYAALFANYVRIVNAGDVAGLRAMMSEEVDRSDYRACKAKMSNKDCLILYIETTVMKQHGRIEATDSFGVDGDTLYGGLVLQSDTIRAAGSQRAFGIDRIRIRNGKIIGLRFLPNLQDAQTKKFFDHIRATGTPSSQPYVNQ
jgi:hypothetical protein